MAGECVSYCLIRHLRADGNHDKPYYVYPDYDPQYGEIWRNFKGGWCLKEGTEILGSGIFCGTKEQFIEMHRKELNEHLLDKDSPYGWLSPFCEWYPCAYTGHQAVAEDYLGFNEEELEERGWIKVFKDYHSNKPVYSQHKANERQLEWLGNHDVHYSQYACYQ